MSGGIGGAHGRDPRIGAAAPIGGDEQEHGAGADAAAPAGGADAAARGARPRSDVGGLHLLAALEARLLAHGAPAATPPPTTAAPPPRATPLPASAIGTPRPQIVPSVGPRPQAGAVDAKVIEDLIAANDPTRMTNEFLARTRALFTVDASGVHLRSPAPAGEVNRFKVCLDVLEQHGKIPDLRQLLSASSPAGVTLDGKPLPPPVTPDDIGNVLLHAYGSPSQQLRWDRAPPLTAWGAGATGGPKPAAQVSALPNGTYVATIGGAQVELGADMKKFFDLPASPRYYAWSNARGAGGFENEGQGLSVYDVRTGRKRQVLAEYFPIDDVKSATLADGREALLVAMTDGGAGFAHFAVVDPARGEVFRLDRAALAGIRGNQVDVKLFDEDGNAAGTRTYDLAALLAGPVITNAPSPP